MDNWILAILASSAPRSPVGDPSTSTRYLHTRLLRLEKRRNCTLVTGYLAMRKGWTSNTWSILSNLTLPPGISIHAMSGKPSTRRHQAVYRQTRRVFGRSAGGPMREDLIINRSIDLLWFKHRSQSGEQLAKPAKRHYDLPRARLCHKSGMRRHSPPNVASSSAWSISARLPRSHRSNV